MVGVLVSLAVVVALVAATAFWWLDQRKRERRGRRILATPLGATTQPTGAARGRVVATEAGLLASPFSERRGVWVVVVVNQWANTGGQKSSSTWRQKYVSNLANPFVLDDGVRPVRVEPVGGSFLDEGVVLARVNVFEQLPQRVQQHLLAQGLGAQHFYRSSTTILTAVEHVLHEGSVAYALGACRPALGDAYRGGPPAVLSHEPAEAQQLIVTTSAPETIAALDSRATAGPIAVMIGLLVAAGVGLFVALRS